MHILIINNKVKFTNVAHEILCYVMLCYIMLCYVTYLGENTKVIKLILLIQT